MELTLGDLQHSIRKFNEERGWLRLHSPQDLLLSLFAEIGELAELFAFRPPLKEAAQEELEDEMADVFIYLACLADSCQIGLEGAVLRKMEKNARRFSKEDA